VFDITRFLVNLSFKNLSFKKKKQSFFQQQFTYVLLIDVLRYQKGKEAPIRKAEGQKKNLYRRKKDTPK